jgi:hypothetical protein
MKTRKLTQLTQKAQNILTLIEELNARIEERKRQIYIYQNHADPFHAIKLFNTLEGLQARELHLQKVKLRLVNYYANTLTDIIVHSLTQGAFNFNDVELALTKRQNYALN